MNETSLHRVDSQKLMADFSVIFWQRKFVRNL